MDFNSIKRVERLKRWLGRIAYASLVVDICISIATLVSLNIGRNSTVGFIFILNYVLTAIVILSITVFVAILLLSHYDRILDAFAIRGRRRRTVRRR